MGPIGHIDDFDDNTTTSLDRGALKLLLVKHRGEVFLYENNCPHAREPLDPMGGSLATIGGMLIVCQHHGAEFLSHNGQCVAGPCLGESLRALPFTLSAGEIYLD